MAKLPDAEALVEKLAAGQLVPAEVSAALVREAGSSGILETLRAEYELARPFMESAEKAQLPENREKLARTTLGKVAAAERAGVDAAGNLVPLEAGLPRHPGVRDDQLLAHDQAVHVEFLDPGTLLHGLRQAEGGGDGQGDGDEPVFHGNLRGPNG